MKNKIILKTIAKVKKTYDLFVWRSQNKFTHVVVPDSPIEYEKLGKVLVISPHADDELIGCHELLKLDNIEAKMLYVGLLGYQKDNATVRQKRLDEYLAYCEKVYRKCRICSKDWKNDIREEIHNGYTDIFVPSIIDWHWEHREVSYTVIKYVIENDLPINVFFYQVTVPLSCISNYSIANDHKWNVFLEVYKSQSFMPIQRFKLFSGCYEINGIKKTIEPYYQLTKNDMNSIIYEYELTNMKQLDDSKKWINNFTKIRQISTSYWKHVIQNNTNYSVK